ncbi:CGNR zinc finger domain-containing protein [Amycolatopsis sp. NPDC052450]|uniref:CGNR zinc finger domain-containing protein n=1 Tax=Amycolatopsis sp. NPDC052450 TaxID=3363937 RepID=UPI0037C988B9
MHVSPAPGTLDLVCRFVNSCDLEAGTSRRGAPQVLSDWLRHESLLPGTVSASPEDLDYALRLRDSLREAMAANLVGAPTPRHARAAINAAADYSQLTVELDEDGGWSLKPRATGTAAALGGIVAEVVRAMTTQEWNRLKVCVNDTCRRAFYDRSRSRSGRWCSMRTCGNQSKQNAWRRRHASGMAKRT